MNKAFPNFILFILLKWCLFYAFQFAGKSGWQTTDFEGFMFVLVVLLTLPILEILILWWPIQLVLKYKGGLQTLYAAIFFGAEFLLSWLMTSQSVEGWMFGKLGLSVGLFVLFYRKHLHCFAF